MEGNKSQTNSSRVAPRSKSIYSILKTSTDFLTIFNLTRESLAPHGMRGEENMMWKLPRQMACWGIDATFLSVRREYWISGNVRNHMNCMLPLYSHLNSGPKIPGLHDFRGPLLHSAHWDSACEYKGKNVAVIGTGSSAIQVRVPESPLPFADWLIAVLYWRFLDHTEHSARCCAPYRVS